jgi:tetratricopeptide (TPR) repeat protein
VSTPQSLIDFKEKSLNEGPLGCYVRWFATAFLIFSFSTFFAGFPLQAEDSLENGLKQDVTDAFQGHDYKKVIRLYREFAASKPDRYLPISVKVLYSQALADTGDLDGAIDAMRDVLSDVHTEMNPIQLQYDLANLLFLQKRLDEARSAYRKLLLQAGRNAEFLSKAKERLAFLKDRDVNAKRKDIESLQMIDLETALDAGEVPDGAEEALGQIMRREPNSAQAVEAKALQDRIKSLRTQKAKTLLDEARRLFDDEKKYVEVRDVLDQIQRSYGDVGEVASIEALRKAVDAKLSKPVR